MQKIDKSVTSIECSQYVKMIADSLLEELNLMATIYDFGTNDKGEYVKGLVKRKIDGSIFFNERIYRIIKFYSMYKEAYIEVLKETYMYNSFNVKNMNCAISMDKDSISYQIFSRFVESCGIERKMYNGVVTGKTTSAPYRSLFYYFCGRPTYDNKPDTVFPYHQGRVDVLNDYLNLEFRRFKAENSNIECEKRVI